MLAIKMKTNDNIKGLEIQGLKKVPLDTDDCCLVLNPQFGSLHSLYRSGFLKPFQPGTQMRNSVFSWDPSLGKYVLGIRAMKCTDLKIKIKNIFFIFYFFLRIGPCFHKLGSQKNTEFLIWVPG